MGVSTDAILCYGYNFDEEGYEFPWGTSPDDLENWWMDLNGYKNPYQDWYDSWDYDNTTDEDRKKLNLYLEHERDWLRTHPIPVEVVHHCHSEFPMWVLAVPGTVTTARRGYPEQIHRLDMRQHAFKDFMEFCKTHVEDTEDLELSWWLASYADY